MTRDGQDIRELTKALKDNTKATDALRQTLIEIERNRRSDSSPYYCIECSNSLCHPNAVMPEDVRCVCCSIKHVPGRINASGS
jgi:hypothetical protein